MATPPHAHTLTYPHIPFSVWLLRLAYTSTFMAIILLSLGAMGMAAFELEHRGHIFPGVRVWGVDLSGMEPVEAALALSTAFTYPQAPAFTLHDESQSWTATPAELGVALDLPATISAAYRVGRSGNPFIDWPTQFEAWDVGVQVAPVVKYDESRMLAYLNHLAPEVYQPTIEASLTAEGTRVITTPGQIGRQLDVAATAAALRDPILRLGTADIPLVFIESPPLILDTAEQAAATRAILSQPLTLVVPKAAEGDPGPWTLDPPTLAAMIKVQRVADGPNAAHFEVGLDPAALRAYLEPLAPAVDRAGHNARFIFNDETRQLELIEHAADERHLDVDATIAAINAGLATTQNIHTIPLVLKITPPQVTDDRTAEQLGITELVVAVSTSFAGSTAERVNNISVAASRFHGLLIPPGAVFSFDDNLGDVSLDAGFAEALIIYAGRTIRGVGGGVCQVSTTVFRAAYYGGYPIVERNSHAYRVGYYERGGTWQLPADHSGRWDGPGLDATVFAPLVDFKFQNDTPYWLLMEVYVSPGASRLTWKFYSTSDGRQVTVAPAVVRNVVPHPEPLYEEDPELPSGTIKQVDYAADGADVTIYRVIARDGVQINPDENPLRTHYQPWRAIYHYGPGTEGIPTPSAETPTP